MGSSLTGQSLNVLTAAGKTNESVGWTMSGGTTSKTLTVDADLTTSTIGALPRSYLAGLALANDTDTDHDIVIAVGTCRDSSNTYNMTLSSVLTKRIDASWAAGDDAGGMATGSVANTTWYHVHLIRKDADGTIDAMFDTSVTAANKPAGYTAYRRIGSVWTDGSANIVQFVQKGDYFQWKTPLEDVTAANTGSSAVTRTLYVPTGVKVRAKMNVYVESGGGEYSEVYFSDLDTDDLAVVVTGAPLASIGGVTAASSAVGQVECQTNTSAQIRTRHKGTGSGSYFKISTYAWLDSRGRDD